MRTFLTQWTLLPSALLTWSIARAYQHELDARDTNISTLAAPISITPDQNFDGIDGAWSTFTLRVGTPAQYVRTLLSFSAYQTWVVLPQGCPTASTASACEQARGGIFTTGDSSTWDPIGIFDLWIERGLGYIGNGQYGYDTVGLGGLGEGGPTLTNTTVGGVAVEDFYLGVFGVNPKPTNFTNYNEPSPSYMTLLKEQKYIPSVSFGYTAGAEYRFTGVLASLTLGGYDKNKFVDNGVEFVFAVDNERDLLIAVQSISTPSQDASTAADTSLLPAPVYALIDSTVPHIWLPIEACRAFETEFGLVYDNTTELYLVNDTLHSTLTQRNPNVTFTLAQGLSGGASVQITLPYAAFDLTASPPFQGLSNSSRYFPLQRAANDSQFTIGRTFLQEAYITVNYETQRFNVSQCSWVQNPEQHLIPLPAYTGDRFGAGSGGSSSGSGSSTSSGISPGAIAGVVVGVIAILALLAGVLWWYLRRKRGEAAAREREKVVETPESQEVRGLHPTVFPKAELEGSPLPEDNRLLSSGGGGSTAPGTAHSMNPPSSVGWFAGGSDAGRSPSSPSGEGTYSSTRSGLPFSPLSETSEADSREYQLYEMPGDMPPVREADGRPLSEKEALDHRNQVYNGVDSASNSTPAVDEGPRISRRINPEDVILPVAAHSAAAAAARRSTARRSSGVIGDLHRAFSFEFEDSDKG